VVEKTSHLRRTPDLPITATLSTRIIAISGSALALLLLLLGGVAAAQPDIRSIVTPASNARGWNNTPVTVSFICAGTASCPEPVTLNDDGATQRVTRAVEDAQGGRAEATAIVNIDMMPATLSRIAPASGEWTTKDAAVTIGASVRDELSGVATATCNGEPARVAGTSITCTRSLREGSNDIIVSAIDAAGNSSATAVRIWREVATRGIHIVPQNLTIGVNFREILQLLDDSGRTLSNAICTSANPGVVQVLEDALPCTVKGIGAGKTIVTATVGELSATVTITVLNDPKAPLGTTLFTLPPTPGFTLDQRVRPADQPGGPALMLVEVAEGGAPYRVKAISHEPRMLWYEWPAIAAHERIVRWMGDTTGGGLLLLEGAHGEPSAIVRIGRPRQGTLWRYESVGRLNASWAMNWEGTLFIVETPRDGFPQIVGIDSLTGRTLFRQPVPRASRKGLDAICETGTGRPRAGDTPPMIGNATVPDSDGAAFALIEVEPLDPLDETVRPCEARETATRYALKLLRVLGDGQFTVRPLRDITVAPGRGAPQFTLHAVVSSPDRSLLVPVRTTMPDGSIDRRIIRIDADNTQTEYTLPLLNDLWIGNAGWAYASDGHTAVAFEPASGEVQWSYAPPAGSITIKFVTSLRALIVETDEGLLKIDASGVATREMPPTGLRNLMPWR
jgi:hypothetical protein